MRALQISAIPKFARYCSTLAPRPKRVIVGLTGATGSIIGIRLLEALKLAGVETHAVVSKWGISTMEYETKYSVGDIKQLASHFYHIKDMSAAISSGSYEVDSMVIAPCSVKTLAACRIGFGDDLIVRAADVILKERRKLVLVVRETPLSNIHLENMLSLSRNGAVIFPPVPAFYTMPESLDDMVNQSVGRILDQIGIDTGAFKRWQGGLKH